MINSEDLKKMLAMAQADTASNHWEMGWNCALSHAILLIGELEREEQARLVDEHHDFVRERIKELHGEIDTKLSVFMEGE